MPTSEYWRKYKQGYRRKQQLQRQQLEGKDAQYLADFGALQRDINSFRQKYNTKQRSDLTMEDMVNLGGSESGALQHGMMHESHRRDLQEHQREHVSLEEHVALRSRVDALEEIIRVMQTALDTVTDVVHEHDMELYPEEVK